MSNSARAGLGLATSRASAASPDEVVTQAIVRDVDLGARALARWR